MGPKLPILFYIYFDYLDHFLIKIIYNFDIKSWPSPKLPNKGWPSPQMKGGHPLISIRIFPLCGSPAPLSPRSRSTDAAVAAAPAAAAPEAAAAVAAAAAEMQQLLLGI